VIHWIFRFDFADGTSVTMDELAYQRWDGEQIAEGGSTTTPRSARASSRDHDPARAAQRLRPGVGSP
jgi:hypothetical protein